VKKFTLWTREKQGEHFPDQQRGTPSIVGKKRHSMEERMTWSHIPRRLCGTQTIVKKKHIMDVRMTGAHKPYYLELYC